VELREEAQRDLGGLSTRHAQCSGEALVAFHLAELHELLGAHGLIEL